MAPATKSKSKVKIQPLADRVVVQPLEETEEMRGGLYIPDTAKEKPQQGEIVAVGPGRVEKGDHVPMELKVGQKVLYGKYSGTEVTFDDVLLSSDGKKVNTGKPNLSGAKVTAEILRHGKGEKIVIFKFKRRKNYRRKTGHRQQFTEIKITSLKLS